MPWIMDCSVAAALGLPDESSAIADAFLLQISNEKTWVPSLWWHEIGNVLVSARRRGRISDNDVSGLIQLYGDLPINTDTAMGADLMARIHHLSITYKLSAYDAAYLELAERKQAGLATLDNKLLQAARDCGVEVFQA
ncbi:type II toxin-antitoxin system VapC family toxin [Mariprofundus ferrooxydans]|nr:type II toxin-antitoxin system VapC family toxin [Mariprofundus ferrooxydans]